MEPNPAYLTQVFALATAGAPVAAPDRVGRRVSWWPWMGTTDLAALIDSGDAGWHRAVTEAGRTLARVHVLGRGASAVRRPEQTRVQRFAALGQDFAALDGRLAVRFGRLTGTVLRLTEEHPDGLIHGDCSADQVAVDTDTVAATWLDFERIRVGDVRDDLGSFAAAELLRAPARRLRRSPRSSRGTKLPETRRELPATWRELPGTRRHCVRGRPVPCWAGC